MVSAEINGSYVMKKQFVNKTAMIFRKIKLLCDGVPDIENLQYFLYFSSLYVFSLYVT